MLSTPRNSDISVYKASSINPIFLWDSYTRSVYQPQRFLTFQALTAPLLLMFCQNYFPVQDDYHWNKWWILDLVIGYRFFLTIFLPKSLRWSCISTLIFISTSTLYLFAWFWSFTISNTLTSVSLYKLIYQIFKSLYLMWLHPVKHWNYGALDFTMRSSSSKHQWDCVWSA